MVLNDLFNSLDGLLLIIGPIFLFFILREVFTWYWKINHAIRILERIERNLRKEGVGYPDEEHDEEGFKRKGIKIPGEDLTK